MSSNKNKSDYVYKPTGEIISGADLERIISEKEQKTKEKKLNKLEAENFIKQYYGSYYHFIYGSLCNDSKEGDRIMLNYGSRLLRLACEMEYDTGRLVDLKSKPYKSMNEQQIIDLLKISETDWKRTRKYLVDNKLLKFSGKGRNKEFYLNTDICLKGELSSKTINTKLLGVTRVFTHSYTYMYDNLENKERNTLFYLARLLPHVNVEYNIICSNPFEEDENKIEPLSVGQMCNYMEIEPRNFSRVMSKLGKLKVNGKCVLCKVIADDSVCYIMNPALFYQGNNRDSLRLIEGLMDKTNRK